MSSVQAGREEAQCGGSYLAQTQVGSRMQAGPVCTAELLHATLLVTAGLGPNRKSVSGTAHAGSSGAAWRNATWQHQQRTCQGQQDQVGHLDREWQWKLRTGACTSGSTLGRSCRQKVLWKSSAGIIYHFFLKSPNYPRTTFGEFLG